MDINDDGFFETIYGLESCSKCDAVEDIRNNAEEIAEAVEEIKDKINLPESLMEKISWQNKNNMVIYSHKH